VTDKFTEQSTPLILQRLQIDKVRNLRSVDLVLHPGINYFHGANGAGKTSILEALYILVHGKTFRHGRSENWIQHGAEMAQVIVEYQQRCAQAGSQELKPAADADFSQHRLGLQRSRHDWQARHNGNQLSSYAQLSKLLPLILFEPSSHQLIESGPDYRRQFLDWGVFHVEPEYLKLWRRYQKALKQRNASLKSSTDDALVRAIEPVMASAAEQLNAMRSNFFANFSAAYVQVQKQLAPDFDAITLAYEPGYSMTEGLQQQWRNALEQDRQRGFTWHGPHRADIRLKTSHRSARGWLSRGQQKMVALTMLLAKQSVWQQKTNSGAVLLLDDVESELDQYHLQRLLRLLLEEKRQVLITGTSAGVGGGAEDRMFHVEHGQVSTSR
jgi:DNA replication and repair protein RecF